MDKEYGYLYKIPNRNLVILGDVFSLIAQSKVTLISSVIDKDKYYVSYSDNDVELRAWRHLIERCDMAIADLRRQNQNYYENGLVITDHYSSDTHDERIREFFQLTRLTGTGFHYVKYIIEDPLFTISTFRNLIQVADAVAYCTVLNILKDPFFVTQFQTIEHKFRHSSSGEIKNYGVKIFPE